MKNIRNITLPFLLKGAFCLFPVFQIAIFMFKHNEILSKISIQPKGLQIVLIIWIVFCEILVIPALYYVLKVVAAIKIENNQIYIWQVFGWKPLEKIDIQEVRTILDNKGLMIKANGVNPFNRIIIPFNFSPDAAGETCNRIRELIK